MFAVDEIWLHSPSPAMRLGPAPHTWRVNDAARAWAHRAEFGAGRITAWQSVAAALEDAVAHAPGGRLQSPPLVWRRVALQEGWLVWLQPDQTTPAASPWRSARDKFALVQDLLAIGVFERDLRTLEGRWDAQLYKTFGLDTANGTPTIAAVVDCVHPDDRERFLAEYERFSREGGRHRMGFRIVRPDGGVRDLLAMFEVQLDAEDRPLTMIGLYIDDTEGAGKIRLHRAETGYLERALDLAKVAVWRVDFSTRRAHFNAVAYRAIGLDPTPEGLPLETQRQWLHPEDFAKVVQADWRAVRSEAFVDVDVRYRFGGGPYAMLTTRRVAERNASGAVIGLVGVTLNQSEQTAERERATSLSRRIELIAEAADLGVWSVDGEDGHVEWNAQMFKIYGLANEQQPATLTQWRDAWVHPEDRDHLTRGAERAQRVAAPGFETEFRIVRPDGTVRWVTSRSRREIRGRHVTMIGIHLDTTELRMQRRVAEQVLVEKEIALRASRARAEFLARASHELRTPLNAVIGFAQLIGHDGMRATPELQLERVLHIRAAGEQLLALVDNMLERGPIETGRGAAFGAGDAVERAAPAPRSDVALPTAVAAAAEAPPLLTMLYIEDNPVNTILVEGLVALRPGVQLRCAVDGLSGVAAARVQRPQVVLLDMQLPDIDGGEVQRRLRAAPELIGVQIIALSANTVHEDIERALAEGFDDYWTKPIDFKRFLSRLDEMIETARAGGWTERRASAQGASRSRTHSPASSR